MDEELKHYLDEKFAQIDVKFDGICGKSDGIGLTPQPETTGGSFIARLDRFEEAILAAFRDLACPKDVRDPSVATMLKGFYERRALAEQRIFELERKRAS